MPGQAELSATDLARAITFADHVVESAAAGLTYPTQLAPDINAYETIFILAQTIVLLFQEVNGGG